MYAVGFSVNNLSLMALTIAAGFVVDDAIVMIENIARRIEGWRKRSRPRSMAPGSRFIHHHFADRLAACGTDPAAFHA